MKARGLILTKTLFQERHLISKILLKNGRVVSVLFYGGQGGGKKKKSSVLEIGHYLSLELVPPKNEQGLFQAKDHQLDWGHKNIREDYRAFYLLHFYAELILKSAQEHSKNDSAENSADEGLFLVLSNAIVHLEKKCFEKNLNPQQELFLFLGKMLGAQGVFPPLNECILTAQSLENDFVFSLAVGGFVRREGHTFLDGDLDLQTSRNLKNGLQRISRGKYGEIQMEDIFINDHMIQSLVQFFCNQFQFDWRSVKGLNLALGQL